MGSFEGLNGDFRSRLEALVKASGGKVTLTQGFRSVDEQTRIWNQKLKQYGGNEREANKWAAKPGKSNHGKGIAADLGGDLKLAARLAPQFGLHFPMSHEPWHVEPMGVKEDPDARTVPMTMEEDGMDAPPVDPIAQKMNELAQVFNNNVELPEQQGMLPGGNVPDVGATPDQTKIPGMEPNTDYTVTPGATGVPGAKGGSGKINAGASVKGFNSEQMANAAVIVRVGRERGLSDFAIQVALATAMQESGMRNVNYGDRDSLGLFQQRPSQGWGSPQQVRDPSYAAGKFYDGLVKVKGWEKMALTQAAQKVQRSAYPDAYAKHTGVAQQLLSAIGG